MSGSRLVATVVVGFILVVDGRTASAQLDAEADSVVVWAPVGASETDLGRLYDAHFRPVRGTVYSGSPQPSQVSDTYREVIQQASPVELQARARFPAFGGALSVGRAESLGYIRAISLRRVARVPPTAEIERVPGAAYFVSEIRFGFAFELQVVGSGDRVGASVDAIAAGGSARIEIQSTRIRGGTRGLRANGNEIEAMASSSPGEILRNFSTDGEPQALFFVLESLPTHADAEHTPSVRNTTASGPGRFEVHAVSLGFPARNTQRNNAPWDPIGGPDMAVDFFQGGRHIRTIAAARDRDADTFESAPLGELVSVSPENPIVVRFRDVDLRVHDSAGEAQITELHDGEIRVTTPYGAQLVIRVVSR